MFPNGIDKHTTLADVQAQGLFRVHIFSGLTGVDGRQDPLELLRGDVDRITVFYEEWRTRAEARKGKPP